MDVRWMDVFRGRDCGHGRGPLNLQPPVPCRCQGATNRRRRGQRKKDGLRLEGRGFGWASHVTASSPFRSGAVSSVRNGG